MADAVIDACCLIDLLSSRRAEDILSSAGFDWHVPAAVDSEVQYIRQRDPDRPGQTIAVPADLTPVFSAGVLKACQPENDQELERFAQYAASFRSDGEAMCLAIAECRGWTVATDDRKAIRVGRQAGLVVVSCPELVKAWAELTQPDEAVLGGVLRDIQLLAQFVPNPSMAEYQWWVDQLARSAP